MSLSLDQIVESIRRRTPLAKIATDLLSDDERELLRRCALVRSFDRAVVDRVLRRPEYPSEITELSVPFAQFIEHPAVEALPRAEGVYRLRSKEREDYLKTWWAGMSPRPELIVLSRGLVRYYVARGLPLQVLYHLPVVDPVWTVELFEDLYAEADERFDLARCRDLVTLFDEQPSLPGALVKRRNDRRSYLEARSFWADDYYRTTSHVERAALTAALDRLLRGEHWILHLYGTGGMGKTMFLRWAVSRRCAPEPERIPCVLIDCNQTDLALMVRDPWRLELHLARQLNRQLTEAPFGELLGDLAQAANRLDRHGDQAPDEGQVRRLIPRAFERFTATLASESPPDRPVVLIFDTLEKALLHREVDLLAVFRHVADLHRQCPAIRLLLSGRYNLCDPGRLPEVSGLDPGFVSLEVAAFTDEEAEGYLVQKRGLSDRAMVKAIVAGAHGLPFKLALAADLLRKWEATPAQMQEEIERGLEYLIRRIVSQIENRRVRWVLLYGAVPWQLNYAFLTDVMAPYLRKGLLQGADCGPVRKLPGDLQKLQPFPTDPSLQADPGQDIHFKVLWDDLKQYASDSSWIRPVAGQSDTLELQPDVLNPLRWLLQGEPDTWDLHRDAFFYFRHKAEAEPQRWVHWMRQAVYHDFQLRGSAAGKDWRALFEAEDVRDHPEWRRELATEVVGDAYVDIDLKPRPHLGGKPMIDLDDLAWAYYQLARSNIDMARTAVDTDQEVWNEVAKALAAALELQERVERPDVLRARLAVVRAELMVNRREPDLALRVLEEASPRARDPDDQLEIEVACGDIRATLGQRAACQHYRNALELVATHARRADGRILARIHQCLAREALKFDQIEEALQACAAAWAALEGGSAPPELAMHLTLHEGAAWTRLGDGAAALRVLDGTQRLDRDIPHTAEERARIYLAGAETLLTLQRPLEALERCLGERDRRSGFSGLQWRERMEGWGVGSMGSDVVPASGRREPLSPALQAEEKELRGRILAELMELQRASETLTEAQSLWTRSSSQDLAHGSLLAAEFQLEHIGNLNEANNLLFGSWSGLGLSTEGGVVFEWLRAQLRVRMGELDEARQLLDRLVSGDRPDWPPRMLARVAMARLALSDVRTQGPHLQVLLNALGEVRPPQARLSLLAPLSRCPVLEAVPETVVNAFLRLIPDPREATNLQPRDRHLLALYAVELHRVLGRVEFARELLDSADALLTDGNTTFPLRQLFLSRDRLGWRPGELQQRRGDLDRFLVEFERYPTLCGVTLLEHAERFLGAEEPAEEEELLTASRRHLESLSLRTQWRARLKELEGRLAARHGEQSAARAAFLDAADDYLTLGDRLAGEGLQAEAGPQPVARPPGPRETAVLVQVAQAENALAIRVRFPERETPPRVIDPRGLLGGPIEEISQQTFSYPFLEKFNADMTATATELTNWLLSAEDLAAFGTEVIRHIVVEKKSAEAGKLLADYKIKDLRLEFDSTWLQSLPWEFMMVPGLAGYFLSELPTIGCLYRSAALPRSVFPPRKWLQTALNDIVHANLPIDGSESPEMRQAIEEFQTLFSLKVTGFAEAETCAALDRTLRANRDEKRPPVLILQPSLERQKRSSRGPAVHGFNLEEVYRYGGFEPTVIENPEFQPIQAYLARQVPAVIHIVAGLLDTPSGLQLDFAGGAATEPGVETSTAAWRTTTMLDYSMQQVPDTALKPLVILDVYRPSAGGTETLKQLALRNAFASEVFSLGNTPALLGIGLGIADKPRTVSEALVRTLTQNNPLREIRKRIKSDLLPNVTRPELLVAHIGVALFAVDPDARPPGSGTLR